MEIANLIHFFLEGYTCVPESNLMIICSKDEVCDHIDELKDLYDEDLLRYSYGILNIPDNIDGLIEKYLTTDMSKKLFINIINSSYRRNGKIYQYGKDPELKPLLDRLEKIEKDMTVEEVLMLRMTL